MSDIYILYMLNFSSVGNSAHAVLMNARRARTRSSTSIGEGDKLLSALQASPGGAEALNSLSRFGSSKKGGPPPLPRTPSASGNKAKPSPQAYLSLLGGGAGGGIGAKTKPNPLDLLSPKGSAASAGGGLTPGSKAASKYASLLGGSRANLSVLSPQGAAAAKARAGGKADLSSLSPKPRPGVLGRADLSSLSPRKPVAEKKDYLSLLGGGKKR